jgi:ribosomal-protein-alanine N-acetyltransferase
MTFPKLVTKNLTLRELKSKDIFDLMALLSDSETMKLFGGGALKSDLDAKGLIENIRLDFESGDAIFWVITLSDEREFIGFIKIMAYKGHYFDASFASLGELKNDPKLLEYIDKTGWETDYALLKPYRQKGIMTEALRAVLEYCSANAHSPLYAKVNSLKNKATLALLISNNFIACLPQANHDGELGMIYKWQK